MNRLLRIVCAFAVVLSFSFAFLSSASTLEAKEKKKNEKKVKKEKSEKKEREDPFKAASAAGKKKQANPFKAHLTRIKKAEEKGLKAGKDDYKAAVIDAMKNTSSVGITSTYAFDEFNNPIKQAVIIKIEGGKENFSQMF